MTTKTKFNAMRRTNFSSNDEDQAQKYVPTENLEPLTNPEKVFKKHFDLI